MSNFHQPVPAFVDSLSFKAQGTSVTRPHPIPSLPSYASGCSVMFSVLLGDFACYLLMLKAW